MSRKKAGARAINLLLVLMIFMSKPVMADEIILVNGDRMTGTIVSISDGILTLETDYAEPMKLKFTAVAQLSSTGPVELHLADGEVLKGRITTTADRRLTVAAGSGRAETAVDFDSITALNPPPKKPVSWKGNINVGGNWQEGNSQTMNISAGAQATRRTDKDRFKLNLLYNLAEDDGERTSESYYGQLKYDYFLTPKWYLYLNLDMLSDGFEDINLRSSVGPGVGYQIWEGEDLALGLEAGVSYTSEDREQGEDTDWVTARLGADFLYRLFDRVVLTDQLVIYPSLDHTGEYTLRNEAGLVTEMGASLALRLSNIWERNSDPGPDVKKDDLTWILGLQYNF